jgi:DNA-binding MarR family transcriptional regulator
MKVILQIVKPEKAALSPILRSDTQGMILAQLFMNPGDDFSISELARQANTSAPTAMREVERLLESQLVIQRTIGRARLIRVNTKHELHDAIRKIVAFSYGPAAVLPAALYGIEGLEQAFLYGNYAAYLKKERASDSPEIDLLLVGYVNRIEASNAAKRVESYLDRSVNVKFVGSQEWEMVSSDFVVEVKQRPLFQLFTNL